MSASFLLPPSTINPPCSKPCRPIPERRPRPVHRASSSTDTSVIAGEPEDRAGDGQAKLSSDSQADMFGRDALDANMGGRQRHSGFAHLPLKMLDELRDPRRMWALDEPRRRGLDHEIDPRRRRSSNRRRRTDDVACGPQPRRPKCKRLGVRMRMRGFVMRAIDSGPTRNHVARRFHVHAGARG